MSAPAGDPIAMLVTDRHRFGAGEAARCARLVELTTAAARAGVTVIQVRERGLDDGRLLALVRSIVEAAGGTTARVVVNERADIAMAAGAHGVHLPAAGVPADRVRAIVPGAALVGRSVHSAAEAADNAGLDYLVFGSVYETASKPAGHIVNGIAALRDTCRAARVPVLAIGGVTPRHFEDVARAGAAGIAGIGLFADRAGEADVAALLHELRAAFAAARAPDGPGRTLSSC